MADYFTIHQRLDSLLSLCKLKSTGSAKDLAKRYNTSQRTVMRMIDTLRCEGYDIVYDRFINSYSIQYCFWV